ncbi:MAG: ATP synthase F1 subunit gamma [Patescibacteria group bacterium]
MAVSTRIIKSRIKSVQNTKKITKAMELVSAAKMRRAIQSVLASRPYSTLAWNMVSDLAKVTDIAHHPLLSRRPAVRKIGIICITSDRGLCGGFNAQILKAVAVFAKDRAKEAVDCEFILVGKKGQDVARRMGWQVAAAFAGFTGALSISQIQPVASLAAADFISGKYDAVMLAYTDFISTLKQAPRVLQLLPLNRISGLGEVGESLPRKEAGESEKKRLSAGYEYSFEPSPQRVLDVMLPRLIESQIYQALFESSASEHSARMMAMKSATDSAAEMIGDLAFSYNQARQAAITREIAEISAGKAALE